MDEQAGWQLSGEASEAYEQYVVPYILGPWAPRLVDLATLQQGERVLDLACGTGLVARLAAQKVSSEGKVTGIDLNIGILAVAGKLPPPPGAPITWVEGSALAMDLPSASFDVILCQQGSSFFRTSPQHCVRYIGSSCQGDGCSSVYGKRQVLIALP